MNEVSRCLLNESLLLSCCCFFFWQVNSSSQILNGTMIADFFQIFRWCDIIFRIVIIAFIEFFESIDH